MVAYRVIGLGFGDEGKGSVVDYLASQNENPLVIRFNGGPQAGHNVVTEDGRHHTFAQFGSGMFNPACKTYLSRFMLIDPLAMLNERQHLIDLGLPDPLQRTSINGECIIITPFHQAFNRISEMVRGTENHGSCGIGLGEAVFDNITHPELTIRVVDLMLPHAAFIQKLKLMQEYKRHQLRELNTAISLRDDIPFTRELYVLETTEIVNYIHDRYQEFIRIVRHGAFDRLHPLFVDDDYVAKNLYPYATLIFEGAQGVLLDEKYGFYPYTTWSNTTYHNASILLDEAKYHDKVVDIGVLRSYGTRHGPGPFVSEFKHHSHDFDNYYTDHNNPTNDWQGSFRVGTFDLVMAKYALSVLGGIDYLALTHMDKLPPFNRVCYQYVPPYGGYRSSKELNSITPDFDNLTIESQEEITNLLQGCHPVLVAVPSGMFVEYIEHELDVPVGLLSFGPKASDKEFIHNTTKERVGR